MSKFTKKKEYVSEEIVKKTAKELETMSKPFPKFIKEIISLYDVDVPFYYVPCVVVLQFTGADAIATIWREPPGLGEVQGVLIAYDELTEDETSLLENVLHEIGHLKLLDETDKTKLKIAKGFGNISSSSALFLMRFSVEGKVEKWTSKELEKLKPFINQEKDGWERGITIEEVKKSKRDLER